MAAKKFGFRKILRWTITLMLLAVIFVLLGAWLQGDVLPRMVRKIALRKLRELGYPDANLRVVQLDPWKITLRDITLDHSNHFRIAHLKLTFSPLLLWHGKLDELTILGLRDSISSVQGQWDFGLPTAAATTQASSTKTKSPATSAGNLPAWIISQFPFSKVTIAASEIDLSIDAMKMNLPIEAAITRIDAQNLDAQIKLQAPQGAVELKAHLAPTQCDFTLASPKLEIALGQNLCKIAGISLDSQIKWDEQTQLQSVSATGKIGAGKWSVLELNTATISLDANEKGTAMAVGITTPDGHWTLDSKFPGVMEIQKKWSQFSATASVEGSSKLPAMVLSQLKSRGLDAARLGAVNLKTIAKIALDANSDWSVVLPEISLTLEPGHLALTQSPGATTTIDDLCALVSLHGQADRNGFSLAFSKEAVIEASAINGPIALLGRSDPVKKTNGHVAFALLPFLEKPLLAQLQKTGGNQAGNAPMEIALVMRLQQPMAVKQNGISADFNALAAAGTATIFSDEPLAVAARITADAASVQSLSQGWEIRNVKLDLPVSLDAKKSVVPATQPEATTKPANGNWSIGQVRVAGNAFENFSGSMEMINNGLRATVDWLPFGAAKTATKPAPEKTQAIHLNGWIDWAGGALQCECNGNMPEIQLSDSAALKKLIPRIGNVNVTGKFVADGHVKMEHGRIVEQRMQLWVGDVDVALPDSDTQITGISGGLALKNFWPPESPSEQAFTIKELRAGKAKLYNGYFAVGIEDAETIFLERMQWGFGEGGKFLLHPLRLHLGDDEIDLEIFIEDFSLAEWLGFLTDGKVTGTGRMYGWLPVSIAWTGDRLLHFGEGFLYAKPGTGLLQLHQEAVEDAKNLAKTEGQEASMSEIVRQRALAALSDFQYDMLRFDFAKSRENAENLICKIQAKGAGRSGDKQEIGGLSVDIPHFDKVLGDLIMFKLQLADPLQRFYDKFTKTGAKTKAANPITPATQNAPMMTQPAATNPAAATTAPAK